MPYYPASQQYQTPMDPIEAARQAQEELIRQAQEARARQAQQAQQQQAQNTAATIAGIRGMDALTGGSTAVAPAAEATAASNAAYGGNALVSGASEPLGAAPFGGVGVGGLAAGAYTGYQQATGLQSAAKGGNLSTQQQGALALPTFGTSLVYNKAKSLWDKDKYQTEGKRLSSLKDKGVDVPDALAGPTHLKNGRSKEELLNRNAPTDLVGYDPNGDWTNNPFSQSRKESDLKPEDIWGYSTFMEKFGNDWLQKFNEDQRFAISQKALETGAVREHDGTVDVDWTNKDLDAYVTAMQKGEIKPESYSRVRDGITEMDRATSASPSSGSPTGAASNFDAMLSSSIKQANDMAAANAKAAKQSGLAKMAISNSQKELPQIQSSGTVRTGVQDLDNILQGVLG